MDQGNKVTKTQ